jgi:hypothetical protein
VTLNWRTLNNLELHNLYSAPDAEVGEVGGACSTHGRNEKCR